MPVDIHFTDHGLGVVLRTIGSVPRKKFVDTLVAFIHENEKALSTIRYWYSDYSDADVVDVTSSDIQRIADACIGLARLNTFLVVAVCAPRTLYFGLSRMWEILAEQTSWKTQAFHERNGAKDWLRKTVQEDLTFE